MNMLIIKCFKPVQVPPIGFLVRGVKSFNVSEPKKRILTTYNPAIFNSGAFDAMTGIFTAPLKGLYHFSASFGLQEGVGTLRIECPTGNLTGIQNAAIFQASSAGVVMTGHFSTSMTSLMERGDTAYVSLQLFSQAAVDGSDSLVTGSIVFSELDYFSGALISPV